MNSLKAKGLSILRWSEKYTKTDMVYLFKNSFWVALGQFVTAASGVAVMIFMTNFLSTETYGNYRLITSMVLTFVIFGLPGMNMGITQSVASGYSGQLQEIILMRMKYSMIGSLLISCVGVFYILGDSVELGSALIVSGLFLPFFNTFFSSYFFLQGYKRFRESAILHMLGRIFFACFMILALFATNDLVWLVIMFFISTITGQYLAYRYTKHYYVDKKRERDEELPAFGLRMSLLGAPSVIALYLDKIIIGVFLGPVTLALYAVATMPANESMRFGRLLQQVFLPKFSAEDVERKRDFLKSLIFFTTILAGVWLLYFFAAPFVMSVFGQEYLEATKMSQFAMLIVCFSTVYLFQSYFVAKKMQRIIDIMFIVVPTVRTLLLLLGLFFFGVWGAIFALIASYIFELLVSGYFYITS